MSSVKHTETHTSTIIYCIKFLLISNSIDLKFNQNIVIHFEAGESGPAC